MNNSINEIKQIESTIMDDLEELDYLLQTLAVWSDKNLTLMEADRRVNDLKIKFARKD